MNRIYLAIICFIIILLFIVTIRCNCKKESYKKNLSGSIITFIVPLIGQLLSRFIYIDYPYSKLWLLIPIFWIPPFTMIPSYFIYNNMDLC